MKKILILVIIILLLIITCFAIFKGIGFLNIKGFNNIKEANNTLKNDFDKASELSNKTYPAEVDGLEEAIRKLKISKQEYESKSIYNPEDGVSNTVEIKTYKIHYLWTILGNYRKDRGIQSLNLDLKTTSVQDVYDLEFTLLGGYTNITDFIYDIENDEELNFDISNFTISSGIITETNDTQNSNNTNITQENNNSSTTQNNSTNTSQNSTTVSQSSDGYTINAKFTVNDVGITLD